MYMHEKRIAKNIIRRVHKDYGKDIKKITVSLGELVGISKKELGKNLKKEVSWTINFTNEKSHIKCLCGYEGPARINDRGHDYVMFECPQCGNPLPRPIKGHEIKIIKVEKK